MADEDINLRVRTEGTSEAASEIRGMGTATRDLSADFDNLGQNGRKAKAIFEEAFQFQNITESRAKIDALIQEFTDLQKAIGEIGGPSNRTFIELGTVIDKAKLNLQAFEQQAATITGGLPSLNSYITGFAEVDARINAATAAVDRFDTKEQSGARVWTRDIDLVAQQVKRLELALIEQFGAVEKGTPAAINAYERFRVELTRVNQTGNTLINAYRDNQFAVRQFGNEVQGLGLGVSQLTNLVGGQTARVGQWVAQLGLAGAGFEHLRDAVNSLNLNTVQMNALSGASVLQWGAVIGVLAAAAAAGVELTRTEQGNREQLDGLVESIKKFGSALKTSFTDQVGGAQQELQKTVAELLVFTDGLGKVPLSRTAADAKNLLTQLEQLTVGMTLGKEAADAYWLAHQAGITTLGGEAKVIENATATLKFYHDAQNNGVATQKLWNEAVRNAAGNADKLKAEITVLRPELDRLIEEHKKSAAAAADSAKNHEKLTDDLRRYTEQVKNAHEAERQRSFDAADAVKAQLEMNEVVNGTTKRMSELVAEIKALLPQHETHRVALQHLASELQKVLDTTDGLTAAQRRAIQATIDAAKSNETLTDSVKKLNEAVQASAIQHDANKSAILAAADAAQKELDTNKNLTGVEQQRLTAMIQLAKEIDGLEKAEKKLTDAKKESTEATKDQNAEDKDRLGLKSMDLAQTREQLVQSQLLHAEEEHGITVHGASVKAIQAAIEEKKKLLSSLAEETTAVKAAVVSHNELKVTQEEGRTVISNVTEETVKATGSLKDGTAVISNAAESTVKLTGSLKDGTAAITNIGEEAEKSAGSQKALQQAIQETGDGAGDAQAKLKEVATTMASLPASVSPASEAFRGQMIPVLQEMADLVDKINGGLTDMAGNISKAADAAAAAAAPSGAEGT